MKHFYLFIYLFIALSCSKSNESNLCVDDHETKMIIAKFSDIEADYLLSDYLSYDSLYQFNLSLNQALELGVTEVQYNMKLDHLILINESLLNAYNEGFDVIFIEDKDSLAANIDTRAPDREFYATAGLTSTVPQYGCSFTAQSSTVHCLVSSYPSPCGFRIDNYVYSSIYPGTRLPLYNNGSSSGGFYSWFVHFSVLAQLSSGSWINFVLLNTSM